MPADVQLRAVEPADLPVFFAHQADAEAARLAAFPSRSREAFDAHWRKILGDPACTILTIVHAGRIAGNIGAWTNPHTRERLVGYWIGRDLWGRGIASAALTVFLQIETVRPLTAHVAAGNPASRRVLEKGGFRLSGEERRDGSADAPVVELILTLAG
jgi:RimJ/RimL family protein N-acetyltransferase